MRRLGLLAVAIVVPMAWPSATAQDAAAIGKTLQSARDAHDKAVEAARLKLAKALDAKVEEMAAKGNLEDLKALQAEKEAFDSRGELPAHVLARKPRTDYEEGVKLSKMALRRALEKAKVDYTKARQIAEAEAIDRELRDTAPQVYRPKPKEPPPHDRISGQWTIAIGERQFEGDKIRSVNIRLDDGGGSSLPGCFWRKLGPDGYSITFPNGQTGKVRLGRGGEQFEGRMSTGKRIHGNRKI